MDHGDFSLLGVCEQTDETIGSNPSNSFLSLSESLLSKIVLRGIQVTIGLL